MITIKQFEKEDINDVIQFELDLRKEENFWRWEIDEQYKRDVLDSFEHPSYKNALSFLAYVDGKVVGRIDASFIPTHFDGSMKAYLDWICVIKSYRHQKVAQKLMERLRNECKQRGITTLIGLIASNEEAQRFYHSLNDAEIHDEGIWIGIK